MSDNETNSVKPPPEKASASPSVHSRKAILSFGIFLIFFIYYMSTAILQTPTFKHIASLPLFGIPSGLFLSLMIFPLSWLLIIIYFRIGR